VLARPRQEGVERRAVDRTDVEPDEAPLALDVAAQARLVAEAVVPRADLHALARREPDAARHEIDDADG
jgi:hypothetical protein